MKKQTLLGITFLTSLVLPLCMIPFPGSVTWTHIMAYLSSLSGYTGLAVLLWSLLLGIRSVAGLLPRSLTDSVHVHSLLGKYGTLLIFLHPVFVTLAYQEHWYYAFVPKLGTAFETAMFWGQLAMLLLAVIWITSALLREKITWRPWKYIHFLGYAVMPLALLHVPDTGSSYAAHVSAKLFFFLVYCGFAAAAILRVRGLLNLNKKRYVLVDHVTVGENVKALVLKPVTENDRWWIRPKHGQYVFIKTGFFSEDHPFSVLTCNEQTGVITVGYKLYGAYTQRLARMQKGEEFFVTGAFGDFTSELDDDVPTKAVFVAGGIGVTPFMSRILHENRDREQWLFYANHDAKRAVFEPDIAARLQGRYVPLYSTDVPRDQRGDVFQAAVHGSLPSLSEYHFFLCGPDPLMDVYELSLGKLGVPPAQIHRESFAF